MPQPMVDHTVNLEQPKYCADTTSRCGTGRQQRLLHQLKIKAKRALWGQLEYQTNLSAMLVQTYSPCNRSVESDVDAIKSQS